MSTPPERGSSQAYYGYSVGPGRYRIFGQMYPGLRKEYDPPTTAQLAVDATAVSGGAQRDAAGGTVETWGVTIESPRPGKPDRITIDVSTEMPREERYANLVGQMEAALGRTGLTIMVL